MGPCFEGGLNWFYNGFIRIPNEGPIVGFWLGLRLLGDRTYSRIIRDRQTDRHTDRQIDRWINKIDW